MKRIAAITLLVGTAVLLPLFSGLRVTTCSNKRERGIWLQFGRNGPMFMAVQEFIGQWNKEVETRSVHCQFVGYLSPTNPTKDCDFAIGEWNGAVTLQYANQFGKIESATLLHLKSKR